MPFCPYAASKVLQLYTTKVPGAKQFHARLMPPCVVFDTSTAHDLWHLPPSQQRLINSQNVIKIHTGICVECLAL